MGWVPALILSVVVLGVLAGLVLEVVGRAVARQRVVMKVIATLGLILIVEGLSTIKFGSQPLNINQFLPGGSETFRLGGVNITWAQVTVTAVSVAAVIALFAFFRFSRMGLAMRAVVDDPDLVSLHGMRPRRIRRTAWIIGSLFAALSGVLIAPMVGIQAVTLTFLVVQAFGAAALGAFSNIPLTYLGGILIGIISSLSTKWVLDVNWLSGLPSALPFILLMIVLVLIPKSRLAPPPTTELPAALPWSGPPALRGAVAVPVLVVLALIPLFAGQNLSFFTTGIATAIVILSLGLVVRTAGIISLCQAAFAALGAVIYSQLVTNFSIPTVLAMVIAALMVVPIAALLALPAVRLSGLFFALATLGFGLMMEQFFYPLSFLFTTSTAGRAMPRPAFASSDRAFFYFALAWLVVIAVFIAVIHHGRLGRLLRGMGESAVAMRTLGLDLNVARVLTFCISGFIAAIGGIIYGCGVHFAVLGDSNYSAFYSLVLLGILAIMPFREPWYAVVAGISAVIPAYWHSANTASWLNVIFGLSAVFVAVHGGTQPMPERLRAWLDRRFRRTVEVPLTGERKEPRARFRPTEDGGLKVAALTIRYGGHLAVDNIYLTAPVGTITGLIGPNGAGKTTTFNAISGLVRPKAGTVGFRARDITRADVADRARRGLGRTFQTMQLCEALTVADNVLLGYEAGRGGRSFLRQLWGGRHDRAAATAAAVEAMELCGLTAIAQRQAGTLSTGQRRLVELARCLAGNFELLLLDEPSSGLDVTETARFGDLLLEVVQTRGCGLLVVEHDMSLVLRISSAIYVLDFGKLIATGTPEQIRLDPVVKAAYLGATDLLPEGSAQT
jgi:ABC-type branched-subunit amino acid transport system ATPase component/branched-subunit amino acid ABC-type transport system permease component